MGISKSAEESLYNFTMDGGVGSVYDWEEPKNEEEGKLEMLTTWIEPSKRERKKNYNEDQCFKSQMSGGGGPKAPKLPKMPQTYDFQFYNSKRLTELIDKEKNAIIQKWEITERVKNGDPAPEGAPTLEEIADYDRIIKKIEAGEDKIHRRLEIERILKGKVSQSKDPFNQLKLNYGQNKGKAFNEEEDRYMICMTEKLGYGNWEDLKAEIRAAWQFRFDWFIKSRTPTELGRRVDTLIRLVEKEEPSEHSGKRKGYNDGGGSAKKSKA